MDNNGAIYRTPTDAFIGIINELWLKGQSVTVRDMETRELTGHVVKIAEPMQRCIVLPKRKDSIVAKCAETLWMLAGHDHLAWLTQFLPRAPQFSDDGVRWRGAYGPRLRNWQMETWSGHKNIDQLRYAFELLRDDPYSRQAVISIWNPVIDTKPGKDIPCNNWLQFIARPGANGNMALNLHIAQRSSDVWWGFSGIDLFGWSVLQQLMASWLNMEVGNYTHMFGSLHIYSRHYKVATDVVGAYYAGMQGLSKDVYSSIGVTVPKANPDFESFDAMLDDAMLTVDIMSQMVKAGKPDESLETIWNSLDMIKSNDLVTTLGQVVMLGLLAEDDTHWELIVNLLDRMPLTDLKVAIVEWLCRKNSAILDVMETAVANMYFYVFDWVLGGQA